MIPFLQQVAEVYAEKESDNLSDFCFVFPNKRSATFFSHFMEKALSGQGGLLPEITNITDFVAGFSSLNEANRYDQLFTLFDEYRNIPGVETDFDRFVFWGEMLLSDFNDVDRYLVDADSLFVNVKRLREISSNFLTEEQLEIIKRYWGEERTRETVDRFWNHLDQQADKPQHIKFVKLWEVLKPLYHSFRNRLTDNGLASSGMLYRNAVNMLDRKSGYEPIYKRYIFVGFNVLSTSEIKIFSSLQKMGRADFYWDFNSPAFEIKGNRASRFMKRNIREFPSRYHLTETKIDELPEITILGVPSNIGQVKAAGSTLTRWAENKTISDTENAIDTAVVLPDESLFIPMIHSVPSTITTLNVTMGFPMRLSPMASLIKNIISLQLRSRIRSGQHVYFYEDVKSLLTVGLLRNADENGCKRLENEIQNKRLFTIPSRLIEEIAPKLTPVFTPIGDTDDVSKVHAYVTRLCDFLDKNTGSDEMPSHFIESYRTAANELFDSIRHFNISMHGSSFFKLIERAIANDTIRFIGEPLHGLQIMGMLETRALDFKNIIILSMNERVFPRRHYSRSFIPDALRHGYGMSTIDFQESIFAYYFYRLISRAEHVTLIYDARSVGGMKSSEMSRYLSQLLYFFNGKNISHKLGLYDAQRFTPQPISVRKDNGILKKLNCFRQGGELNLSASALNTYISCPLNFYLQYVEGYNADNDITDYIDSSTYGTVVHEVAQNIYESFQNDDKDPVTITESMLSPLTRANDITLERYITKAINRNFNRLNDDRLLEPLLGECLVISKVIRAAITAMIREDIKLCPFTFVRAEYPMQGVLEISPELSINVRQIIDRIDIVKGMKRFVDYKTGGDVLSTNSIESLFNGETSSRAKAIMQLLLYCHIYNSLNGLDEAIEPTIYKFLSITAKGIEKLKVAKTEIGDYHSVSNEFVKHLKAKVEEIFNPEIDFIQTKKEHNCTFCQFKAMCGRD